MYSVDLTGIAEPHLSTVAAIVGYVHQGRFTEAEAQRMIDRVRVGPGAERPQGTVEPTTPEQSMREQSAQQQAAREHSREWSAGDQSTMPEVPTVREPDPARRRRLGQQPTP
ncbi:hypothetical protein VSH64_16655 [Amycolatopsis rhabdoformis]|uniref:Uncharacterized protein n=1 Tax=Amycolatopsis rhabdoformis TaxID=1448059 RepID=A0ABZ1IH52_9PSEU|nr:hypothetical protein [Amycolatopsis rhabdoformis]WSE33717.1 hypothetical protein VSH64_16655 [Amycolatopsis rhabdoformis]